MLELRSTLLGRESTLAKTQTSTIDYNSVHECIFNFTAFFNIGTWG